MLVGHSISFFCPSSCLSVSSMRTRLDRYQKRYPLHRSGLSTERLQNQRCSDLQALGGDSRPRAAGHTASSARSSSYQAGNTNRQIEWSRFTRVQGNKHLSWGLLRWTTHTVFQVFCCCVTVLVVIVDSQSAMWLQEGWCRYGTERFSS